MVFLALFKVKQYPYTFYFHYNKLTFKLFLKLLLQWIQYLHVGKKDLTMVLRSGDYKASLLTVFTDNQRKENDQYKI